MEENIKVNEKVKQEKPSYEQLEKYCMDITEKYNTLVKNNEQLTQMLNKNDQQMAVVRIQFLFKIIENKEIFGEDFVSECVKEIKESLVANENVDRAE